MTAIYDHLGNYLGDDGNPEFSTTVPLDQMRYELSRMPLRPDGSDVPYTMQEVRSMPSPARQPEPPRPYSTATNVAQAVADRLGISAIPQAALGMISGLPAAVAKELGYPQAAEALQYTPTSRAGMDILEAGAAAPQAITGSHMGFGPLAEYWVPKSGFGLQSRPVLSPSDVQVLGGRAIARGREVAAIPEDFRAAQAGLRRESDLGGPTYGARLQDVTEGLGDYLARQEAMRYSYEPSGSVQVFGNMVPETNLYAVRPSGTSNQVFREVPTALNPRYNVSGESRLTGDLADILDREEPTTNIEVGTRVQPFTNFVPNNFDKSANDLFRDFIMPKLAEEFPGLQNEDLLRAAQVKYGTGLQDWMKSKLEEFAQLPEVKAYNKAAIDTIENDFTIDNPAATLRDVMVVPPSVELAGAQAAENWVMQNMQNYMTEYVGTAADPALQEVIKSGKTVIPLQELEYAANDNARTAIGFRTRAGMPTEGVVRPQLVNVSNERASVDQRLEQIQNEFNALVAANPGVRPADIPGIKELYKEQKTLTKVKDKLEEQAANLQKAVMYEDYMDARVRPIGEQALVEDINPTELQRFPMIPTNKEIMYQMYVPDAFKDLGREIVNKLEAGLITPEAAKNLSVPTAVKMKAELIAKREKLAQEAAKLETQQLTSYIIEETQTLPQDGQYGKGTVVKFDATLSKDQMERALSSECEWMDHCIGRAGTPDDRVLSRKAKALGPGNVGSDDKYVGYIPMVAAHKPGRVVPKGSSGTQTSYMKEFLEGKAEGRSFRDTATGVPFATMKLYKVEDGEYAGKYRMGEFYGYKDRQVDGPWYEGREGGYSVAENKEYRQVVADWANDHADQLKPVANDHLYKYASVYDGQSLDHKSVLAHVLGVKPEQINDIVQQVGKRFVTEDEAKAAKNALREAPTNELEALKETKADLERALRNGNFMDDEEEAVLRGQLVDITDEIRSLQQRGQVVPRQNQPVPVDQVDDLDTELFSATNIIRENYNDTIANVVDSITDGVTNQVGSINDNPRQWIDTLRRDSLNYANRTREALDRLADALETAYVNQNWPIQDAPAQNTTVRPEAINFLANDIVVPNAAFRDQTVEDIATSIRNQLLPTIEQYNPTIPNDREALQRDLQFYQTSPLDAALGQGIELYISSNPSQENRIRESVADFMIQQIENRLGNRAPAQLPAPANFQRILSEFDGNMNDAQVEQRISEIIADTRNSAINLNALLREMEDPDHPQFQWTDADLYDRLHQQVFDTAQNRQVANALPGERYAQRVQQLPATTDAYTTVRRAHTYLVEAGDIEAMTGIANNIMTNQNGPYAQLTDNERTALRAQLQEGIDRVRANEEPTPLSDVIQMDLNRIVDNYDEEVYNEVEGTLSSIGQEYDLDIDPALYIYRVRQHADAALRNNDTTMNSIYENLASQLTRTLRENDAIYDARDRVGNNVNEGLPLTDIQISDIASDYLNNLDNPTPELIRQEADDMRNGMTDLPELRELNGEQALDARNQIANAMEAYADMSEDLEPPEDPGLALPVPEVQRTPEQNAIAQALHYPRFWYQRYPDLPQDVVTGMLHRLNIQHAPPDFAGMRDFAAQGMRRTIFESLNPVQRRQAVAMIDDIANDYQNELQRLDNQPRQQEQYNTVVNAYLGILDANNQFAGLEGLDALRALPQLIRRRSLELRQQLGIANLSADERNALIRDFEELYASRMRDAAEAENRRLTPPGPEGRKRGGLVESLTGVRSYSDLKRDAFNKKYYDDGQAALDFKLRHGTKSDKLGIPYKKYPDYSEEDIVPSKRNEFLNFNQELRRGGRVRRMNSGGINKVRPTPNIPATPAKQNPNTTDYVSKKPVDPGFKETLEKIRGRSNQDLPDNYRAGGSISIDEMKYALMKGR